MSVTVNDETMQSSTGENTFYQLKNNGNSSNFSVRLDSVFSQLGSIEEQHEKYLSDKPGEKSLQKNDPVIVSEEIACQHRSRRSFRSGRAEKVPFGRYIPDFRNNPAKWTRYSLADVSDVTAKSNCRVAMNFINEVRSKKRFREDAGTEELMFARPIFKKPHGGAGSTSQQCEKSYLQDSKCIMPEYGYVIGQKSANDTKKLEANVKQTESDSNCKKIKLSLDFPPESESDECETELPVESTSTKFNTNVKKRSRSLRNRENKDN